MPNTVYLKIDFIIGTESFCMYIQMYMYMCIFQVHVQKRKENVPVHISSSCPKKKRKHEFTKSLLLKSVSVYGPLYTYSLNIDYSGFCRIVHNFL